MVRGAGETQRADPLRAEIADRLGKRVKVVDVVRQDGSEFVWVHIRLPRMPESDLLALEEWVQTELWALKAEHADGLIIAPRYV